MKTKSSLRVFPEHRQTWSKLRALPPSTIEWSILCPGVMLPLSKITYPLANEASAKNISASASVPPQWSSQFFCVPLVGGYLNIMSQALAYTTALENNADFIAEDLLEGKDSQWIYQKVGTREKKK